MIKMETMFNKKSQHNFENFLLKCTEVHKIEIKKCLNVTVDRKTFHTKTLKKSVKDSKQSLRKTKWALKDRNRILRKRERKQFWRKDFLERLKSSAWRKL